MVKYNARKVSNTKSANMIMKSVLQNLDVSQEDNSKVKTPREIGRKEKRRKLKEEKKMKRQRCSEQALATVDKKVKKWRGKRKGISGAEQRKRKRARLELEEHKNDPEVGGSKKITQKIPVLSANEKKIHAKNKMLLRENEEEDKTISKLEKLMYINTKKKKKDKLPSSFALDGLDYLLNVVNHTGVDSNSDDDVYDSDEGPDYEKEETSAQEDNEDTETKDLEDTDSEEASLLGQKESGEENMDMVNSVNKSTGLDDVEDEVNIKQTPLKKVTFSSNIAVKYIPPAQRLQLSADHNEKLKRLKRQMKGLLNRLSESNIHSISTEMEGIYQTNSRASVTEALTDSVLVQFYTPDPIPERLIAESAMLISVLCHNIGLEVVANFLETAVKKLHQLLKLVNYGGGKECNNMVQLICSLYQMKAIQKQVIFDLIDRFIDAFQEKDMELLVLILNTVGFQIRKDDPVSLKRIIEVIMVKSSQIEKSESLSRTKYMLDVLTAIKNNNVRKVTGYDVELINNRRKKVKSVCRKESDTFPDVKYQDLVDADTKGRWWIVGSAWTGAPMLKEAKSVEVPDTAVSSKLIEAGRKLRMNTDVRRKIFYAVMSSDDITEAYEKVMKLGLKGKQLREVGHVLVECCQQERTFNPFYVHMINKLCHHERQFIMSVQCSFWDRFKLLKSMSSRQSSNIATLVASLVLSDAIPLSCLKTIEYTEMDKVTVTFLRQILSYIAKNAISIEQLQALCGKLASNKHCSAIQGLRLFLQHFMLKDSSYIEGNIDIQDALAKMDERLAQGKSSNRLHF